MIINKKFVLGIVTTTNHMARLKNVSCVGVFALPRYVSTFRGALFTDSVNI